MTSSARFLVVMTSIALCFADVRRRSSTTSSSSSSSSSPYQYHLNSVNQQQQQHPQHLLSHHSRHHHHQQQQQLQLPKMTVSVVAKDESGRRGGGGGGGGGEGGSCDEIRAVQATVIRILNDHEDYDRGIDAFESELHALRSDVNRLRKQMERSFVSDDFRSKSTFVGQFPSSASSGSNALPPVGRQDNLTLVVDLQGHQIRQLERRLRWLTKQHKHLKAARDPGTEAAPTAEASVPVHGRTIPPAKEEEEEEEEGKRDGGGGEREREKLLMLRCEREMAITRDQTYKQRDINANVQRKMQQLERMMADNIQSDDHNTQHSSNQHRTHHVGACPTGFLRHLSSCYLFENLTYSWIDAEKKCQLLNPAAHLVSIETEDEELFLLQFRSYNAVRWSSRYLWIGANDMTIEGRWTWVASGSEVIYANWRTGEPSNFREEQHCAYLHAPDGPEATSRGGRTGTAWNSVDGGGGGRTGGRWDDWSCSSTKINFVCEIVLW